MENSSKQDGLNAIIRERIANRIDRGAQNAQKAIERLISEGSMSHDFIAYLGNGEQRASQIAYGRGLATDVDKNPRIQMHLPFEGGQSLSLHDNAVGQLGEKLGVPTRYLKDLAKGSDWERNLALEILNRHSGNAQQNRSLIRVVGDEVRGVLSDSYRRMDAQKLITAFINAGYAQGGVLAEGMMDDTRVYIEMLMPEPLMIPTEKNGIVQMAFGARLSSSDYGDGALDLRVFTMQGVCLNGMVRESIMRKVHLGARLPENLKFSEETYAADTQANAFAIRDITDQVFSKQSIERRCFEIQKASATEVNLVTELKLLEKTGLTKDDVQCVTEIITNNRREDGVEGENTLWKLVTGVTAHGRNQTDTRRERDIQEIAGNLMNRIKVD